MKIQINSIRPKLDKNRQQESFQTSGVNYYPQILTVTDMETGAQYLGEANVRNLPPRWSENEIWEVEMVPDNKREGGTRFINWNRPQSHVGGSSFPSSASTTTGYPNPNPNPVTYSGTPAVEPQPKAPPRTPSSDTFRQSLIIAQTSMKVATEYVVSLSEIERLELIKSLLTEPMNAEEDLICTYAGKIARESVNIAKLILPNLTTPNL